MLQTNNTCNYIVPVQFKQRRRPDATTYSAFETASFSAFETASFSAFETGVFFGVRDGVFFGVRDGADLLDIFRAGVRARAATFALTSAELSQLAA